MYQCIKQYGSIKTGSFWDVDRYIVNSDGERRKVIITNEDNWLLLSMADFENHFAKANKPMTEQEWLQTCTTEQLAGWLNNKIIICAVCDQQKNCEYLINETCHLCPFHEGKNKSWEVWLKQPHKETE